MFFLLLHAFDAHAVPLQLTQQGRVVDSNGVGLTGVELVGFRIYDGPNGGNLLWDEYISIGFTNGYYAAVLGSDSQNNPLDSSTLALYPLYLELQIGGNPAMTPRTAINSSPYSQIAGIAESVEGGTVDASELSINGNPVIDSNGLWVGQPLTVDWANIQGIPSDIADGDANTQLSETQVEGFINNGAIDLHPLTTMNGSGLLTQADTFAPDWTNISNRPSGLDDGDDDALSGLGCAQGEIVGWDGLNWICTSDNSLTEAEVESFITNDGISLNGSTTLAGLAIRTETDPSLADLNCQDGDIVRWDGIAEEWYCTTESMGMMNCNDGEVPSYDSAQGTWVCTNLQSLFDNDGDGVVAWADCDDTNPSILSNVNDSDCDGISYADDCNDNDPNSTSNAVDGDCDGVLTADDCDDTDNTLLEQINDNDCDGVLTINDCDDNDSQSTSIANDADCDGDPSSSDCNDADPSIYNGAVDTCNDGIDQDCDGADAPCSMCGNILHQDPVGGPNGWVLCYIDESDTAYHDTECRDLLDGIPGYGNSSALLSAGGNFGCWHGNSGSQEGAYFAGNNVVSNSCRDNTQHSTKLNSWPTSTTTLGVCIRYP